MRRAVVGNLLDAAGLASRGQILIEDGVIRGRHAADETLRVDLHEDFGDALILPGMVDTHVHCLSETSEGIAAGTAAAAAGGVTTIVEMPFDATGPINDASRLVGKIESVEAEAHVDTALLGTVVPDGGWSEVASMVEAGAVGFKVSTFNTDSRRFPRSNGYQLRHTMAAVAAADSVVSVHAENDTIIRGLLDSPEARDATDPAIHGWVRPVVAEELGVAEALATACEAGARLHLAHLSSPRSVRLARWYVESEGADVSLETCPHYLLFTEDDVLAQGPRLKINPPIRDRAAQEGLWRQLADGLIDAVASDHAPWSPERKSRPRMLDNSSGAPGVETIYPSIVDAAATRGPEVLAQAVAAMTSRPADRFALGDRKGRLEVGYDADIAVYDRSEPWRIDEGCLHSNAGWSPYHGRSIGGRVIRTILRGEDIWDGTSLLRGPGFGEHLRPKR